MNALSDTVYDDIWRWYMIIKMMTMIWDEDKKNYEN